MKRALRNHVDALIEIAEAAINVRETLLELRSYMRAWNYRYGAE